MRPRLAVLTLVAAAAACAVAPPVFASRTKLVGAATPDRRVALTAKVDGGGTKVLTGKVYFIAYRTLLGTATLTGLGAGQDTLGGGQLTTCAISFTSGVKCWGWNGYGQVGDGTTINRRTPVDVSGLVDTAVLATGASHNCALTPKGEVACWGDNRAGQLGDGTRINRSTPVRVMTISLSTISVGSAHTCAITSVAGAVKCWGRNTSGQLGNGTTTDQLAPVDVVGLSGGVVAISSGARHTCAVIATGAVKCWGDNTLGQLGDGTTDQRRKPLVQAAERSS